MRPRNEIDADLELVDGPHSYRVQPRIRLAADVPDLLKQIDREMDRVRAMDYLNQMIGDQLKRSDDYAHRLDIQRRNMTTWWREAEDKLKAVRELVFKLDIIGPPDAFRELLDTIRPVGVRNVNDDSRNV
jgi:hypothetical protein